MPVAFSCPKCSRSMRVPDEAVGKKIKCPGCQEVSLVAAAGATGPKPTAKPATSAATFEQACPKCKKQMRLPAAAAGKQVKCPGCQTAFAAGNTEKAAAKPSTRPAPAAPLNSFGDIGTLPFEDGLISESDLNVSLVRSVPRPAVKDDINTGDGPALPRSHDIYKMPAIATMVAGVLHLILSITLIALVVLFLRSDATSDTGVMIWAVVIGIICLVEAVRIFLGGLAIMKVDDRSRVFAAVGELYAAPLGAFLLSANRWGWLGGLIFAFVFMVFSWPVAIWVMMLVKGEQGKIDFGDLTRDDLEDQARELTRRAAGLGGGH